MCHSRNCHNWHFNVTATAYAGNMRPRNLCLFANAMRCCALLAVIAITAAMGLSQSGDGKASSPYAPAFYNGTLGEPPQLVVFPPAGKQVLIPLPLPGLLRFWAFTPDCRTIFATINTTSSPRTPGHPGRLGPPRLIRVDLLPPVRVTTVADLVGLGDVLGMVLAPSQDKILFLGAGWKGNMDCDLFQIDFRRRIQNAPAKFWL
jgi:hypothetical protein